MSPEPANRTPQNDELEAAIDSLLAEIDTTCTRFENPVTQGEDDDTDGAEPADTSPAAAEPAIAEPAPEDSAPSPPDSGAEEALEQAAASVDDLLERAADDLLDTLESDIAQARPDTAETANPPAPTAGPSTNQSNEDLLDGALDDLLGEPQPAKASDPDPEPAAAIEPGTDPVAEPASEATTEPTADPTAELVPDPEPTDPVESATDAMASLDAAFDDLLDGTFEAADGSVVDTDGLDTEPDPSLMLDADQAEPGATTPAAEPEPDPEPEAQTQADPAPEPAPGPVPEPTPDPRAPRTGTPRSRKQKTGDLLETIRIRVGPIARAGGAAALGLARPIGARVLVLLSKPLEGKPPRVRDSIGWVAIWTLFLAVCVWAYLMIRSPEPAIPDADASRVVTADTPARD